MAYVVMMDDNFHHGDASERYRYGEFADAGTAVEHCRRIVDEYLQLRVRLREYPRGIMQRLHSILDAHESVLWDKSGHIIVTTDRRRLR